MKGSTFHIIPHTSDLLNQFLEKSNFDPIPILQTKKEEQLPVDYFDFYNSVSSVYSAKIEGEDIEYDSFFKFKFLKVPYEPDYTKRSNDLFKAYEFISTSTFSKNNLLKAHSILAKNLLPDTQRGKLRTNPMFVLGENDRIEYVACDQFKLSSEFELFIQDAEYLFETAVLNTTEIFYFAALLHLIFVKIHPFQDGNGRMGRLIEKWFLINALGDVGHAVDLEKNYFLNRTQYYDNIKKVGIEYDTLDYTQSVDFLSMTIKSIDSDKKINE